MKLPVELARLRERYEQLVADAASGAISREDAYRILSQLTVIDGAGALWGLDDEGAFTRRRNPAEPPQVTNPGAFAPPTMVMPTSAPGPQTPMEAAQTMPQNRATAEQPPTAQVPGSGRASRLDAPVDFGRERALPDGAAGATTKPFARHVAHGPSRIEAARRAASSHPATIAVGVLVVASLVVSLVSRGGNDSPDTSTTSTSVAGATTSPATPTTAELRAIPFSSDVDRVVAALFQGPTQAATVLAGGQADALKAAQWAGFAASGFSVRADPVVQLDGTVEQRWVLLDAANTEQAAFRVRWVVTANTWVLADWPVQVG